jgi:uncharacterized membrane protein YtjA (UPF0391 family)
MPAFRRAIEPSSRRALHAAPSSQGVPKEPSPAFCVIRRGNRKENAMLWWALVFLVVAIIAGALGFTGIAGAAAGIARILFFIFLVIFVVWLIFGFFTLA